MSLAKARKLKGVRRRYDEVGSAETSDFPKDGGTSSSGAIERAVDVVKTCCSYTVGLRDYQRGKIRSARKVKHKVVDIGRLDDCLCGS